MFALILIGLIAVVLGFVLTKKLIKNTWIRLAVWIIVFVAACLTGFIALAKTMADFYGARSGSNSSAERQT